MSAGAPAPVLFGKLPDRADFVRKGGGSPALDALDTITQRALWPSLDAPDGPLCRFVYHPPGGPHGLAGALRLSRDRVGRAYPLIAARPFERGGLDPAQAPTWPVRWSPVFDAAAWVVREAVSGRASFDVVAADAMRLPDVDLSPLASPGVARHVAAADRLPASDWFGRFPGGPRRGLAMLAYLTHLLRKGPLPTFCLRLPLPPATDDFGRDDAAAVWLAAAAHVMRARAPWPSLFWSDDVPGHAGTLHVFYGSVSSHAFRFVLQGAPDPATILGIDEAPPASALPTLRAALPAFERQLADPRLSVADVLARLPAVA